MVRQSGPIEPAVWDGFIAAAGRISTGVGDDPGAVPEIPVNAERPQRFDW